MSRGIQYMSTKQLMRVDYETFQPCFFEGEIEEDFYGTPAPSEDIWKKFELLPTPPRSPRRDREPPNIDINATTNTLRLVTEVLDDDFMTTTQTVLFPDPVQQNVSCHCPEPVKKVSKECCQGTLTSKLIQDCMWSGSDSQEETETKPAEKSSKPLVTPAPRPDINASTDCVDPTAVFPYPVSESKNIRLHNLGTETPSDSEDEIIDVETVPVPKKISIIHTSSTSKLLVHSQPASPGATTVVSALKRKSMSVPGSPQPQKRQKRELSAAELKSVVQKLKAVGHNYSKPASRPSSDSEDGFGPEKRAQHNVLERKRRDDLKNSFHVLRDEVPELKCQERAAKVQILKKATEYINGLNHLESSLEKELTAERTKQQNLKKQLELLRTLI